MQRSSLTPVFVSVSSDGKLHDAYISFVNNDYDRKFVNFILKPHLENINGYKVLLNDNDILPGGGKFTFPHYFTWMKLHR